jgi:hypothetical protein
MRDAVWRHLDGRAAVCVVGDDFEGERQFEQLGVEPFSLMPGEPMVLYHWEADQEGFLVVSGEAVLNTATAGFLSTSYGSGGSPPPSMQPAR